MGKKYDNYAKATKAENQAKRRFLEAQGGSTREGYQEAETNQKQARLVAEDAFTEWLADPEG